VDQHQAHLKENLELGRDRRRVALVELLAAVPAMKQEATALGRIRQLLLERFDLPARDQRRKRSQFAKRGLERRAVGPRRLLAARLRPPRRWRPLTSGGGGMRGHERIHRLKVGVR